MRPNAITGSALAVLQRRIELLEFLGRYGRGRDLHPVARERTRIGIHIVDKTAGLQAFHHLHPIIEPVAEGRELVQADASAHGDVSPRFPLMASITSR